MAKIGCFVVDIGNIHLDWGIERNNREREYGEGYIKIPMSEAKRLELYNSNHLGKDEYGINLFFAEFPDGFKKGEEVILKTSGNSGKESKNYEYAKNLHGFRNLKLIKEWFDYRKINFNNKSEVSVKVSIVSENIMRLEII